MKREWKPGDVAMVTSQYGRPVVAVRCGTDAKRMGWAYGDHLNGSPTHHWSSDPDGLHVVRPLVVIDPEDREQVERLRLALAEHYRNDDGDFGVAAALREFANPTPPPCKSSLIFKGAHIPCDQPEGHGLSHANAAAGAIWGEGA